MNKYDYIFGAGFALWAVETICFGFNPTPINNAEHFFDVVVQIMMGYGFIQSVVYNIFNR